MNISIADLTKDIKELTNVANKSFSATLDADLSNWFLFSEMVKAINGNCGICLKAVNDKGLIVGMAYAQQESLINGKEGGEK